MKKLFLSIVTGFMVASLMQPLIVDDSYAKGFSSSSRSSSFSRSSIRSSSSWGSSSKSTKSTSTFWGGKTPAKSTSKATGFTSDAKSNTKTTSLKTSNSNNNFSSGNKTHQTKNVLNAKRQQAKFKQEPKFARSSNVSGKGKKLNRYEVNNTYRSSYGKNPIYQNSRKYDQDTYYNRRNNYYGTGYQPPTYVYNSSPSFGVWDTIFLYHILSSSNSATFAHNHQNDPDFQEWKRQAELEAKENAELRAQLAAMDQGAAKLAGTPIQEGYLPEGVDADIALASAARGSLLPDLKVCTGSKNGAYFLATAGVMAPKINDVNIVPVITEGTNQSLQYIVDGKCDAAFVQSDGYWNYVEDHKTDNLPFARIFSPFKEDVQLICDKNGPSSLSDMDEKNRIWFPKLSGAATTYRNWIGEDDDYENIKTVLTDDSMIVHSYEEALLKVSKTDCAMYVGAPGTRFMRNVEASAKNAGYVLIDIDDSNLDDTTDPSGENVYTTTQIDSSKYPNLLSNNGVFFGSGDLDTLELNADFIVSSKWQQDNVKVYPGMSLQMKSLQTPIANIVNF